MWGTLRTQSARNIEDALFTENTLSHWGRTIHNEDPIYTFRTRYTLRTRYTFRTRRIGSAVLTFIGYKQVDKQKTPNKVCMTLYKPTSWVKDKKLLNDMSYWSTFHIYIIDFILLIAVFRGAGGLWGLSPLDQWNLWFPYEFWDPTSAEK